jgi:3-oxoacyl-[acyl-carrier protein] reductase
MDLGLKGRRALILGGTKGLGRATAKALTDEGGIVAVVGRDQAALDEAVASLGSGARGFKANLSSASAIAPLLEEIDRGFGQVDVLLLNGGGPPPYSATHIDADGWRLQFEALVLAHMRIADHFVPSMRRRGFGRILVVSSTSVREPIPGLAASNALRSALANWAKTLASEVAAEGITVNVLMPGRIATARTERLDRLDAEARGVDPSVIAAESQAGIPMKRYGTPAEFGAMAAFLASDPARYITGIAIPVDGGLTRSLL